LFIGIQPLAPIELLTLVTYNLLILSNIQFIDFVNSELGCEAQLMPNSCKSENLIKLTKFYDSVFKENIARPSGLNLMTVFSKKILPPGLGSKKG
jgi:hypothetical protein